MSTELVVYTFILLIGINLSELIYEGSRNHYLIHSLSRREQ